MRLLPALILLTGLLVATPGLAGSEKTRSFLVEDLIGLTLPREPQAFAPYALKRSTDDRYMAVITQRADLGKDRLIYELLVFDARTCLTTCRPHKVWRAVAPANVTGILGLQWLSGRQLQFVANDQRSGYGVYRVTLPIGHVEKVVSEKHPILNAVSAFDTTHIAWISEAPQRPLFEDERARRTGLSVETETADQLLANRGSGAAANTGRVGDRYLNIETVATRARTVVILEGDYLTPSLSLSRNGQIVALVKREPAEDTTPNPRRSAVLRLYWSDDQKRLIRAPLSSVASDTPVWSESDDALFVTGLSRDRKKGAVRLSRAQGTAEPIQGVSGRIVRARNAHALIVEDADARRQTYLETDGAWGTAETPQADQPSFRIVEGVNDPPRLFRFDNETGTSQPIYDFNPGFDFGRLVKVEVRQIVVGERSYHYGLYLPKGARPCHGFPLMMQTHGFDPKTFQPEGLATSGYSAQAVAQGGIAVVQVPDPVPGALDQEGANAVALYEAIIEQLRQEGLVDKERLAILGWSRTGFSVRYALAESVLRFKAVVLSDALAGGYMSWLASQNLGADYQNLALELNAQTPGGTSGSETFIVSKAAKVKTPVLLFAFGSSSLLETWEDYALRKQYGSAVVLKYFPDALHAPRLPAERLAVMNAVVPFVTDTLQSQTKGLCP
ncbi:alpha/beta hydrolase family protein [Asticcacaulis excentricus]|uniref:Peptidase S9 prolyl oligopeptidase catalytic domain-containing protein n=1 Tax=Asticcacaulis excentricus (strain ATCC 15261 / DSM 4724 / KCTC 12464 / NCIMB 9791 / VKM B-1370 / CB 48) TaxID=573065 RepID=E8RMD6_ASTEC|nr:prolyl oligopeptidase family serine peptidase [Asticcacaulis excentricus]ADU13887.1 hypothetical protein Astex_2231 [Asticcacaulis excentricus CB 48]